MEISCLILLPPSFSGQFLAGLAGPVLGVFFVKYFFWPCGRLFVTDWTREGFYDRPCCVSLNCSTTIKQEKFKHVFLRLEKIVKEYWNLMLQYPEVLVYFTDKCPTTLYEEPTFLKYVRKGVTLL